MNKYIEFRRNQNLKRIELPSKEKLYYDLINIEHSWSGRIDASIINTFIMEAEQQLVNAIELFELGYFDCAYYSLRSAVDTSTTIVFLADMPDMDREKYLEKWKNTEDFPMQGQMVKMLVQKGNIFRDMKVKMPRFFVEAKDLSAELNKYVHKQGLEHFYVSRNHPLNRNELQESFIEKFEAYFRKCTRIVAVMRLAIDPFPILLMDKEILYRCFDSMTDPYSSSFVEEYIGKKTIEEYKETEIYKGTYEAFIHDEKQSKATFNVTKHQYIDTKRINEIFEQFHLLNKWDQKAVLLINSCSKITKVYVGSGFFFYFTD